MPTNQGRGADGETLAVALGDAEPLADHDGLGDSEPVVDAEMDVLGDVDAARESEAIVLRVTLASGDGEAKMDALGDVDAA